MTVVFTKHYSTPAARATAERNHAWLTAHAAPLRLPKIIRTTPSQLVFQHVSGRHAEPRDLPAVAEHLGHAHATAWTFTLRNARLATRHPTPGGHALPDFPTRRLIALGQRLSGGYVCPSEAWQSRLRMIRWSKCLPAAFYKDTNPRNILITPTGALVTVDTDDLTLAPFGYDLAKLIVTLAMTHGALPTDLTAQALTAYNTATLAHHPSLAVTHHDLMAYADFHGILTAPYLGRGGYRWPWHAVRS